MLNQDLLDQAKAAYDSGNYAGALRGYYTLLKEQKANFEPGEAGLVYHMLGNCLVKMRSFDDAEKAYKKALEDTDYENLTAVHSNYGLALTSTGEYRKAIEQFELVLKDPTYKTPYKTYSGLGNAYLQLGDYASAGTAYRNAAVDDRAVQLIARKSDNFRACIFHCAPVAQPFGSYPAQKAKLRVIDKHTVSLPAVQIRRAMMAE